MTLLKSDSRYNSKLETDSENAQSECVAIMIGFKIEIKCSLHLIFIFGLFVILY